MNSGPAAGGFDISSLTRQMPAIPAPGHQSAASHHLHHASAFSGHQPQHQPQIHQQTHPHHMQQHPHHHSHLLLPNIGLGNPILSSGLHSHPPHHQPSPMQPIPSHHPVQSHHMQGHVTSDTLTHHFNPPHALHHQPAAQHMQQHQQHHPPNTAIHQVQHVSHTGHASPQSLPSPHHCASVPTSVRVMSDATNALASSVNLSSIQSLVDVLVELPLPSEAPDVVQTHCRLLTLDQQTMLQSCVSSFELQHGLSRSLSSAMQAAKQQLNQLNLSIRHKRDVTRNGYDAGGGKNSHIESNSIAFSRIHRDNSYILSVLQQMDALNPGVLVPSLATDNRSQNQYWSPWSATDSCSQVATPQPAPSHSPYVSSPSPFASRGTATNQTPVYNDNSNSSSSFSAEPITTSVGATPPAHQYAQQSQQQQLQQQQQHQYSYSESAVEHPVLQDDQQLLHQVDMSNYYRNAEPVVVLERSELMEKALQEYYANGPNGTDSCAPGLADRVKSNKRQRSNSSHSKSEKKEHKSKHRERSDSRSSPSPIKKKAKVKTSSDQSNHYLSSTEPSLSTTFSSALPPSEKFEAILDELFNLGKGSSEIKKKKKKKSSSSSSDESDADEDNGHEAKTNGDSTLPSLFDISIDSNTLAQLVGVTAKLKKNHQMQSAPVSKISNLLTVLTQQLTVQSAGLKKRKSEDASAAGSDEDDEESNITTSSSLMQKFESCCDNCLIALYILASKGMSSRVYLEECIEQIVAFLNGTIQQFTTIGASAVSPSKSKSKSPKKSNTYISPTSGANKKILAKMYTKWSELIGLLVELLSLRPASLTDTLVLSTTRLALGAFFLENLNANSSLSSFSASNCNSNEIQLNALNLTTTIFSQYPGHRGVILEELLQSIARLPTSKRGRVIYKVDSDDGSASISMFSALLQQLIQSLFLKKEKIEETEADKLNAIEDKNLKSIAQSLKQQYEAALKVAFTFLNTFLRKCCGLTVGGQTVSSSDGDYRILFEGLVSDLMVTLHKPNWPAAQLLVQVLVKILITNITSTTQKGKGSSSGAGSAQAQLNLRLASLDHLGTICSRFSKELSDVDGTKNEVKISLNSILTGECENVKRKPGENDKSDEENDDSVEVSKRKKKKKRRSSRKILDFLESDERMLKEIWKHLIRYFDEEKMLEQKNLLASIWLKEMERDIESQSGQSRDDEEETSGVVCLSNREQLEAKVRAFMNLYATAANANLEDDEYHVVDSKTAELIIRYLDISQSTTVKLFDSALGHIIAALSTTSNTTMRSRAMKSFSNILNNAKKESAKELLSRGDLQRALKAALLDSSTSVREATIDLIGKFVLSAQSEELVDKYYDIISDRILDTGVSVRKRVIKILREICLAYPSYKKVPDICAKIIKRVNDDGEGIRKLVTETFTSMWFKEEKDRESIRLKVASINHVVATVITDRIGTEWLQKLLENLFGSQTEQNKKKTVTEMAEDEEDSKVTQSVHQLQQVTNSSSQIVDVLVGEVLCGEGGQSNAAQTKSEILSAITTIWLFSKVCPNLLLNHISTLHLYLSTKCSTQLDIMVLSKVVQIIEHVLPKLSNPSESLLAKIEEDLTKNILSSNASVVSTCVSCLSAVIHKHSNNKALAQDLFRRFFTILDNYIQASASNPDYLKQPKVRPCLLRALFVCGLFAKHFSFLDQKDQLYNILVRFVKENLATEDSPYARDSDVLIKALSGLGFLFEGNPPFSLKHETVEIYRSILRCSFGSEEYRELVQCQVLKNLVNYLSDEFTSEMTSTVNWSKENLKSMSSEEGDSLQSSIIQCYLSDVLRCTLSPVIGVRRSAVSVIHIIHNGGHVHPLQLVPYLIAMSSDDDGTIRFRADHVLNEIERKYHGYVSMKSKVGVHLSYQLHSHCGRRGYRIENVNQSVPSSGTPTAPSAPSSSDEKLIAGRLATLYAVVASNRQSRRAFVASLLKYFDMVGEAASSGFSDVMTSINIGVESLEEDRAQLQQFVCDNIVWLPYTVWDEPLYILTQLELNLSILASHVQSQFKDILNLTDDDEDALDAKDEAQNEPLEPERPDTPESQDQPPVSGDSFFVSDLKSYIPKPMPSILAVSELIKVLRAYYMLIWCKNLVRELYGIQDVKVQEYSPNENQKVWDKAVHRKTIDITIVDKLMSYPRVMIDVDKINDDIRNHILTEYQRFKKIQLTGVDPMCTNYSLL